MNHTGQIYTGGELVDHSGIRKPSEIVAEYEAKRESLVDELNTFVAAQIRLLSASCVSGTTAIDARLDEAKISIRDLEARLLESAWRYTYKAYNIEQLASAKDKRRIDAMFAKPPAFTLDAIREHFGDYVADPRGSILRGLAEVFSDLDPAFKSHEKMKIGVKGLPKRVIITGLNSYHGHARNRIFSILNAIAAYQGKPLPTGTEICALMDDGDALRVDWEEKDFRGEIKEYPGRGVWLKRFQNGNGHLFFAPKTLKDINLALAEYYGDVLPDCPEERPARAQSTAVAKDLQFYASTSSVIERLLRDMIWRGLRVLEPSCGDGRILDALRGQGADVFGIEYDAGRAKQARAKNHTVLTANFLNFPPKPEYDAVVMNPPFYGRHYAKHVRHALKFLKPGGVLRAVLPITARYDHGELDDLNPQWTDLPVGSFRESGTNINTTIAHISVKP
ncbi:MAG: DUF4942 domain-containing protein [Rhodobacteraceae bacterium]|nr:MAG: DUF4942 domain-containing protein [Paracoccaceae bacterium]